MQDFPIPGSTALITGAASGIGLALARKLAAQGCNLALLDCDASGLQLAAAACRGTGVTVSEHVADLSQLAAIDALPAAVMAAHGRVNILVNNAGVALAGNFSDASAEDFDFIMAVDFAAPVRLTRAFLPWLSREDAAHIVNISSIFGIVAPPGQSAYSAAKFALRGFSESLRHELIKAGSKVSLTIVHPGGIHTNIARHARIPRGIDAAHARARAEEMTERDLTLLPARAAEQISRAIAARAPRLLIGKDAKWIERLQRIFPVSYWRYLTRLSPGR
jgi:short-subunit dehydrogenase